MKEEDKVLREPISSNNIIKFKQNNSDKEKWPKQVKNQVMRKEKNQPKLFKHILEDIKQGNMFGN